MEVKCEKCPECGHEDTIHEMDDVISEGYRVCARCKQEWFVDIDYNS